jgi:hypothetical protein
MFVAPPFEDMALPLFQSGQTAQPNEFENVIRGLLSTNSYYLFSLFWNNALTFANYCWSIFLFSSSFSNPEKLPYFAK